MRSRRPGPGRTRSREAGRAWRPLPAARWLPRLAPARPGSPRLPRSRWCRQAAGSGWLSSDYTGGGRFSHPHLDYPLSAFRRWPPRPGELLELSSCDDRP